jgi:hypothetical protein
MKDVGVSDPGGLETQPDIRALAEAEANRVFVRIAQDIHNGDLPLYPPPHVVSLLHPEQFM